MTTAIRVWTSCTRVDEDVAAKLKKLADAKEWSPSKYIEKLIRQHIEAEETKGRKGGKR